MNYLPLLFDAVVFGFILYAAWWEQARKRQAQANADLRRELRRQPDTLQRDITRICNQEAR